MNKAAILKLAGFILVPFLVMLIATYFLYPYLNEGKYEEIVQSNQDDFGQPLGLEDSAMFFNAQDTLIALTSTDSLDTDSITIVDSLTVDEWKQLKDDSAKNLAEIVSMQMLIDSLQIANKKLQEEKTLMLAEAETNSEDFIQKVKSLLNLEEEELSPILSKMSNEQLVRLYKSGGTIQREKILRSLNSDRAASLMSEIML